MSERRSGEAELVGLRSEEGVIGVDLYGPRRPATPRRRDSIGMLDAVVAVALGAIAFVVRRHVPHDGLFYDDAWQAFGAWKGSLSEVVSVGQSQPGFTAGLMAWTRLFGASTTSLVTPALIAGALGPPGLYVVLRWFDFSRPIALLAGAALSSAQIHILYSYHVKTYTTDVLVVLGLAVAVRHLAVRRWTRSSALAWFVGSLVVGSFSSIALIATVVAGLMLLMHPSGDRKLRLVVVVGQIAALGGLYLASSRTYNHRRIRGFFASRGGFIDFDPNPVTFAGEVFGHFRNVADVFPGGVPILAMAAGVAGLLAAAWRGPLTVPARFLGLMVVITAGASIVHLIPFGPPRVLGRVSLWLVPAMALGLCATLELARRRIGARATLRRGLDAILCIGAAVVLATAVGADRPYPSGARAAIRHVIDAVDPDDAIIITWPTRYSFALYAEAPVDVRFTPERAVGFLPAFSDERLHQHDFDTRPRQFDEFVDGADRVYVVHAIIKTPGEPRYLFGLAVELTLRGFTLQSSRTIEAGQIDIWRGQPGAREARSPDNGHPWRRAPRQA